ncbi:MAG: hypothetical protein AAFX09_07250 [Pseudomonadota bacterium]
MTEKENAGADNQADPVGPAGPRMGEVLEAGFGWNARMLRTLLDSLINPVAVCRAALAGDDERYVSAIRAFILIFGAAIAVSAFLIGGGLVSLSAMTGADPQVLAGWAEPSGRSLEAIDQTVSGWTNIIVWPITILAASPYILIFKLMAQRITLYGHTLVYLITSNGVLLLQLALILALAPFVDIATNSQVSTIAVVVVYLVILFRVFLAIYARTLIGAVLRLIATIALIPVSLVLVSVLQFLAMELVLQLRFDLSLLTLMQLQAGASS